jgi:ADP-ribosylglycohydrolase
MFVSRHAEGEQVDLTTEQLARAAGVLLGGAVGDALGVPFEFKPTLGPDDVPAMNGGGLGPYEPGEYSDDTQMAVMIAEPLSRGADVRTPMRLELVARGFLRWRAEGASDIGAQTASVLGSTARVLAVGGTEGMGPSEIMARAAFALHQRTGRTAGNGSLMRTAPIALRYLNDPEGCAEAARAVSELTHFDPLAGDACVIWCEAIRQAVLTGTFDGTICRLIPGDRRAQWEMWLADAAMSVPSKFGRNGYVVTALQAAYAAVHAAQRGERPGFAAGVFAAVRAGHDTDTVAAIAGALLGALHGAAAIPEGYRAQVHGWPGVGGEQLAQLGRQIAEEGAALCG